VSLGDGDHSTADAIIMKRGLSMPRESLEKLYRHQLQDLYSAEMQILEALPAMAERAAHSELKRALREHERVTVEQLRRLDEIFRSLGEEPGRETCKGMAGLIAEGEKAMQEFQDPDVLDAALIAAAQHVEHYEIAGYGCARTYASTLGLDEHATLLEETLEEEDEADIELSDLAIEVVNIDALKS